MSRAEPNPVAKRPSRDNPRLAVGIDVVAIDDVQEALPRVGDRYLSRVFTDHEIACSSGAGKARARHLASAFCG